MSTIARFYEPFFSFADVDNILEETYKARMNAAFERQNTPYPLLKPKMDLHENPEKNTITATFELPGLTKEQVNINLHHNRLTVSGEITDLSKRNQDGYVIKERKSGKFSRTVALPERTEVDAIKASMKDGILTVTFPKSSAGQEPQHVTVS